MSREDDARIEVWLGNVIPWTATSKDQKELANAYDFRWTDPTFNALRSWDYINAYSTCNSTAIQLFPILLAKGYRPMLGADTDEMDRITGDWRCKLWIPNGRFINWFAPTIAAAISGAVIELITKLEK